MSKLTFRNLLILSLIIFLLPAIFNGCGRPPLPPVITGIISGQAADPIYSSAKHIIGYTPIANAKVTIVDAEGVTHTTYTDNEGCYHFDNLAVKANTIINIIKELPDGGKKVYKDIVPLAVSSEENYDAGIADAESTALALVVEALMELGQSQEEIDLDEITFSDGFDKLEEDIQHAQGDNQDINTDNSITTQAEEIANNIVNPPTPSPAPTPTYTLTMSKTGSGTGTTTPTTGIHTYDYGTLVTVSASPASSSTFTGWSGDASGTSDVTLTTTEDKSVTATFTLKSYTITASAGSNGTIVPSGATTVNHGLNQTFTITPAANYHIVDVLVDVGSVGAVGTYTFTNVTVDHTIAATFAINSYTVTFDKNGGDEDADPTAKIVDHGGNVGTLPVEPTKTGYDFASWKTEPDGSGDEFAAATVVTADIIVYAKWICTTSYSIGDIGPAGGWIFYDNGCYSDAWKGQYLEAAPASTEWTDKQWGSYGTTIGETLTGIGTGQSNTTTIVTWLDNNTDDTQQDVTNKTDRAAYLCDALTEGGYSDWFLPSKDELNLMYTNLYQKGVGDFADYYYYSSSEYNAYYACYQNFYYGYQYYYDKYYYTRIRAVRAF